MTPIAEKRVMQVVLAGVLLLPFSAAIVSVTQGPSFLGHVPVVPTDLDSHFRYVSGVFLGMLCGYVSCIPAIERRAARLRLLAAMTMTGGAMRLVSLLSVGVPSKGHLIGLCIELGVVPLMLLWQARLARRFA